MICLRGYQADAKKMVERALLEYKRVLFYLPTGGGKTVTFSSIGMDFSGTVLILAHRQELIGQASRTLNRCGVDHSFIGGAPSRVIVGSIQTAVSRIKTLSTPDLIIADEAHHSISGQWTKLFNHFSESMILGVTATPSRLDGRGLNERYSFMVKGPSMPALIGTGDLVPSMIFSIPLADFSGVKKRAGDYAKDELDGVIQEQKSIILGDALKHYNKMSHGKKAVVFTHSVAMAREVAESFCGAGYRFASLDGGMSDAERLKIVNGIESGELDGITSCDIVSEGFDCPDLETAILLRPTQSLSLYIQQVGRVLRPAKGKAYGLILDHVGNAHRFGPPDIEREWSLEGKEQGSAKSKNDLQIRTCADCFAVIRASAATCPICGVVRFTQEREIKRLDGELVLFEFGERKEVLIGEKAMRYYDELQSLRKRLNQLRNLQQLENVGIERNTAWNMLRADKKMREQTGENNMAYEQKNNSGSIFKNDRKTQPSHPDYKGSALVGDKNMWVSAWVKESNGGKKFLSLSFTPKVQQEVPSGGFGAQSQDDGRDLPF